MSAPIIAFFNNKGGVGKTSLVYHLAWMYADHGYRVIAADLDSQANLTAAFVNEEVLETLWPEHGMSTTIFGSLQPLLKGTGDVSQATLVNINDNIALIAGDLALSRFEDQLSESWPKCLAGDERAFRVTSAFWRIVEEAAIAHKADLVLMDLGPNLGAINRSALLAADEVVIPLAPDLFSLRGLQNLGPLFLSWREEWRQRLEKRPAGELNLPEGRMHTKGYVVLQHSVRLDRPVRAYSRWIERIPGAYRRYVLDQQDTPPHSVANDPYCLARLKNYHSLMPMAEEARKPIFHLKPADGAIGAHLSAAQEALRDFRDLAKNIWFAPHPV